MIEKLIVTDNTKSPLRYITDLKNFENGTEYVFKPGVNIIVGENGCGKSTLLKLIKKYLLVDYIECDKGEYNSNINALFHDYKSEANDNSFNFKKTLLGGIEVFADYEKNTFRLCHTEEKRGNDSALKTFSSFGTYYTQLSSSTGEGVLVAINSLFGYIFSKDAKLSYDYSQFRDGNYDEYVDYVDQHRIKNNNEWTIIMDEPDRNLSIDSINDIRCILDYHKENTQIIAVIHNPLLIYSLSKNKNINFLELTPGYINKIVESINSLVYGNTSMAT